MKSIEKKSEDILKMSGVNAGYDRSPVLFDVSLRIRKGSICALIGPNGCGKSTLLKTIVGLTNIYSGSIKFNEEEIAKKKSHEIVKKGITYVSQTENLYTNLTVKENFVIGGYTLSKQELDTRRKEVLQHFPLVKKFMVKKVSTLSGGERQLTALAVSMLRKPDYILLDEPCASLAPKYVTMIYDSVKNMNKMGVTFLIVEQAVKQVLRNAGDAYILVAGRIHVHDEANKLLKNPNLDKLFLGVM